MMMPSKRSPIQLDLKDLGTKPSTSGSHHFVPATFTTIALLTIYLLLNTPSASTTNPEDKQTQDQSGSDTKTTLLAATPGSDIGTQSKVQDEELIVNERTSQAKTNHLNSALETTAIVDTTQPELEKISTPAKPLPILLAMLATKEQKNNNIDSRFRTLLTTYKSPIESPVKTAKYPNLTNQPSAKKDLTQSTSARLDTAQSPSQETEVIESTNLIWSISKVQKDDTLSQIFSRNDLSSRLAYKLAQLDEAKALLKIRPGQKLMLGKDSDGELSELKYPINKFDTLIVKIEADGLAKSQTITQEPEIRINNAKATITHSLLSASQNAGVPLNTMYNFIALFGWQVDFTNDIHKGDQFSIIYEELYLNDEMVGNGNIIAAELLVSGRTLQAVRHEDDDGFVDYYAPNGEGIKGTFLRSPLKFGHITSNFSKNRKHPIKNIWRAHKGVDYGAPRGTPIMATGDGVVRSANRQGGYGKTVIIRHGGKYDTVYAHLNGYAKGIRGGSRVKQGEVIGYVGSTGLATGPHLHYEFRINGVHKNPVTVEFPKSEPINKKYLSQFQKMSSRWIAELDYLRDITIAKLQ